jgi:hypothetical protein
MKSLSLVLISCAGLWACSAAAQSSYNFEPGRYTDLADYMIQTSTTVQDDAKANNAGPERTHCAMESFARYIWGDGDYQKLSDAVSGKAKMTRADDTRIQGMADLRLKDPETKKVQEQAWVDCKGIQG